MMEYERPLIELLINALHEHGIGHVFGIPGDYALTIFKAIEESPLDLICTCDEQGSGFAADAYARVRGLGCVAVTYGVGALKLVNSTAQAYAERSPVVVISGAPGLSERAGDALLHHRVGDFNTQLRVFTEVTVAQAVLSDPRTAHAEILRVLSTAKETKRPVYIEIPRDVVSVPCVVRSPLPTSPTLSDSGFDTDTLGEALEEVQSMLDAADNPVIVAGVEMSRLGLGKLLVSFIRHARIPFATTIMGKSVVCEEEPGFLGVYSGGMCEEEIRTRVENADCILLLGCMLSDLNTGIFTASLPRKKTISATIDKLTVGLHQYLGVDPEALVQGLLETNLRSRDALKKKPLPSSTFDAELGKKATVQRVFECLNSKLKSNHAVIADPGDALFAATDLTIRGSAFLACAYYASLGFAMPGALGAALACPEWRPLVLVGDGAFQMTGVELSSCARYGVKPIVIVLDNSGYGTERPMLDGSFNDVHAWDVSVVTKLIKSGNSYPVRTEDDLEGALSAAVKETNEISVIHVHLAQDDFSPALVRLTANLRTRV